MRVGHPKSIVNVAFYKPASFRRSVMTAVLVACYAIVLYFVYDTMVIFWVRGRFLLLEKCVVWCRSHVRSMPHRMQSHTKGNPHRAALVELEIIKEKVWSVWLLWPLSLMWRFILTRAKQTNATS